MAFNLDDPFGDILSDNDNNSFFDNIKKSSKTLPFKSNRKLDDIFGTKDEKTEYKQSPVKKAETYLKPVATSTPRITRQKPTLSNDNDDEDNDDLGFDPKKPKVLTTSNLFDDILGTIEKKRPVTAKPTVSRQSTDTTDTTAHMQTRPKTSTGRRSSGNSAIVNPDPLGLFSIATKEKDSHVTGSELSTPKMKKRTTTADWLGLNVAPENQMEINKGSHKEANTEDHENSTSKGPQTSKPKEKDEHLDIPSRNEETHSHETVFNPVEQFKMPQTPVAVPNTMLLNTINLESQNAFNALRQQDSQLTLATQMKKQEMVLVEMQHKQEALLKHQEKQFTDLLQQQLQRQQQLEEHIRLQQQRINNHIQLLMTQPTLPTPALNHFQSEDMIEAKAKIEQDMTLQAPLQDVVRLEADVKRLELEKLRLEELVENIKVNFDKEMEVIESSFRKQIKVLEEHQLSVETRLKSEIEDLHDDYGKKLRVIAEEKQSQKAEYDIQLATMKQDNEDEIRRLRKSQEDDLKILKEEHRRMIETIRQTKMLEFAVVQENGSYLETLKAASSNLADVSDGLQTLRDEMQTKLETIHREKLFKLEVREKQIQDAEKRLALTQETAEDEKRRLMELVSNLELQVARHTKVSAEENWQLRQQMATLEAERKVLAREKLIMREQFERDEKRIADLKEQQLEEGKRCMLDIEAERTRLSVEKAKFETERRLLPQNDLEKQRAEMEATMQIAQDATRQADGERLRYHRMQRELEQSKRELIDRENTLRAKEEELEQEIQITRLAERKSLENQQRARVAEQNFQSKLKYLQQRMREIGEKEGKLSNEQLLLARERIKVENIKTRMAEQKCVLCKMSEQSADITNMLQATDETDTRPVPSTENIGFIRSGEEFRYALSQGNVVDRMLDENIAESYRRMRQTAGNAGDYWTDSVLDDDSKEFALHNLDGKNQINNTEAPPLDILISTQNT